MKITLMKMMMVMSSITPFMKTPMALGFILMIQTFMSTVIMSKMLTNSWLTMIMFLMFIGGLLVLFMYMSSIASNEKFKVNITMIVMMTIVIMPFEELLLNNLTQDPMDTNQIMESSSMSKMYNKSGTLITNLMFCYLLLTMIMVTKITKIYKGPLKAK